MVTIEELKNISLYTIDKKNNDTFSEPLDTTQLDDHVITTYAVNIINKVYNNQRELEFNYISSTENEERELDSDHPIVSKIKHILNNPVDTSLFKNKTKNIANTLFSHTPTNAKKGDLLTCLFKKVDKYYFVLLKIDENKILKRGADGLWTINSGLDVETKLQKAAYIEIPIVDNSYQSDYLQWSVKAIDNISNDSYYWNINFLNAHYKSDSKINSERFGNFFKSFINTVSNPLKQNDLTFSYRSYLRTNDNFSLEEFVTTVFGTSEEYEDERSRFTESIIATSQSQDTGFDLVFNFHQETVRKEYQAKGGFTFDERIKILPTRTTGNETIDENILRENINFNDEDNPDGFEDDNGKYVKVYYQEYKYEYK